VADVEHEGAAAHGRAVGPGRGDAQIVRDGHRAFPGRGDAVDIRGFEAAVGQGVEGGVGVQADHRHVRDLAEVRGLGGAHDGDGAGLHGFTLPPA
jgi:hypothetical protein